MRRRFLKWLFVFLILLVAGAAGLFLLLFRPVAQSKTNDLAELFNHGSIGNEEAQGIPYWIWRVLPQIFPDRLPANRDGWSAFGLFWKTGDVVPVGLSVKTLGTIERVTPNCAFCHQGSYRLSADAPAQLVNAGPGTRVNPQAYIRFLIDVGDDARFTSDRVLSEIAKIYDMPLWERALYRFVLVPATRAAFREQAMRFAWTKSRPDWGPGRIDPFNPVKFQNLKLTDDGTIGNSDMMPLWSLADVVSTNTRRFSLHWDGLQTDLYETVVSGAIGDGMTFKSYPGTEASLRRVMDFVRLQGPTSIALFNDPTNRRSFYLDGADVDKGHVLYNGTCAVCHETRGARYRMPIPIVELGTDRHRIDMWTPAARDRYAAYEAKYAWKFTNFRKSEGYVATSLRGLWLRGPYLHNGSVPTLRALLSVPSERPKRFFRGYDLVDAENGGFASTPESVAAKYGVLYDTEEPGNGNQGHLWGTDLTAAEKEQLLSYLKTL